MRKHHELKAWQEAMNLVQEVYQATRQFPQHEQYGLTSPLHRAAVSAPSNVAEGAARESPKEFAQFLVVARGSPSEVETQTLIARNLGHIPEGDSGVIQKRMETVFALIGGLLRSLRQRTAS
ncbi:TPA: four helix bundle protein [Candidatus Acetothermia bacterium]|nr:four helix bundle protein [Candidatus Acetothermia bacterium]